MYYSIVIIIFPPFHLMFCWKRLLSNQKNYLSMKTKHSSKRGSLDCKSSFIDRQSYDKIQPRNVSKYNRLEKKMKSSSWTSHMLKQYFLIVDALRPTPMQQQGIPKQATQLDYITQTHDQIKQYIIDNPNSQEGKEAGLIYDEVKKNTLKLLSKAERYNIRRLNVPESVKKEGGNAIQGKAEVVPRNNGERIHIKLEEVL